MTIKSRKEWQRDTHTAGGAREIRLGHDGDGVRADHATRAHIGLPKKNPKKRMSLIAQRTWCIRCALATPKQCSGHTMGQRGRMPPDWCCMDNKLRVTSAATCQDRQKKLKQCIMEACLETLFFSSRRCEQKKEAICTSGATSASQGI